MDELGLLCPENTPSEHSPRAIYDPNLLHNQRVLELLLTMEDHYTVSCAYWKYAQTEVQPFMRKVVTTWMLEVCEEQNCEETVFPVAVNYMDRFLAKTNIMKSQLQLLGAVCLLLASKFRQCRHLTADILVYYTDYSVTKEEILAWELLVLGRLKWDLASVVANDFIDHLLWRLSVKEDRSTVRRHATTFISLCSTELKFTPYSPSLIATASVAAAANGLHWIKKQWSTLDELLRMLQQITGIEAKTIWCCVEQIEEIVESNRNTSQTTLTKSNITPPSGNKASSSSNSLSSSQPETPTDVQDVLFWKKKEQLAHV
ncbi:G1/S-specific cyclin-D3-like [Tachypleus tridentatus]|uniref:G1/S-specific cyclin-D3-like n=1 Tax=Tachypleus tridentatus TaxID=6853 RepID=UPI003FD13333